MRNKMKTERNSEGNLLVWTSDGTEIIFSEEATKRIELFQNTDEVIRTCANALLSELGYHEEEQEQVCDLEEEVIDIQENISDLCKNQEHIFNDLISIRNDMYKMNTILNVLNVRLIEMGR